MIVPRSLRTRRSFGFDAEPHSPEQTLLTLSEPSGSHGEHRFARARAVGVDDRDPGRYGAWWHSERQRRVGVDREAARCDRTDPDGRGSREVEALEGDGRADRTPGRVEVGDDRSHREHLTAYSLAEVVGDQNPG